MKSMEARIKAELALKREEMKQAGKKQILIESEVRAINTAADSLRVLIESNADLIPQGTKETLQRKLAEANELIKKVRTSNAAANESKTLEATFRKMEALTKQTIRACSKFAA